MNQDYCFGCMRKRAPGESRCPICGYWHGLETISEYALLPGTYLANGRHLIGKVLMQDGFSIAYIGVDMHLQRKAIIKEFFPMKEASREKGSPDVKWHNLLDGENSGREKFIKEAGKIAKTGNIIGLPQVLDLFYQNKTAYIVMGAIEGVPLKEKLIREGNMTAEAAFKTFTPAMEAVELMHRSGLIHLNIRPASVVIDQDEIAWIMDTNTAVDMGRRTADNVKRMQFFATTEFSPIEQYMGKAIGPWTDVYAMCALIYYSMNGMAPPRALDRITKDTLTYPVDVPVPVARVLERGLEIHWQDRIQSMQQLLIDFRNAIQMLAP